MNIRIFLRIYKYICTLANCSMLMHGYVCMYVSTSCTCILTIQDACMQYNYTHVRTYMLIMYIIYSYVKLSLLHDDNS